MSIPKILIDKVKQGEVVLLLGSGALYDATLPDNKTIPFGNDLRNILADEFLDGEFKDSSLAYVAELSISESSIFDVQDFIKEYLEGLQPAEYHYKLAEFKWRRLYTTNYDLLVENIYNQRENKTGSLQKLLPIYSDSNIIDGYKLKDNQLEYFKLHGCVTRTREDGLPLVLTIDDFNNTLVEKRKDMLNTLYEMAVSYSIVFVGHSNQDPNIRAIMNSVRKETSQAQTHYLIKPGANDIEVRSWQTKKITILNMGFQEFLNNLDRGISTNDRKLSFALKQHDYPIQKFFITHQKPSHALANLLDMDCQFIHSNIPIGDSKPEDFYKGNDVGWSGIHLKYVIERSLQIKFVRESFKKPEAEKSEPVEFIVITGASGSGKTTFLRQLAWLAQTETTAIPLWVKQGGEPDIEAIAEIYNKTDERVYLFWDNLELNKKYISKFIKAAKSRKLKVSIVGCERSNLWSSQCENLDEFSTKLYKLNRVSKDEIDKLMYKLEEFNILNSYLKSLSHELRCEYVENTSERHLLVALYEITTGRRFQEIIEDEFDRILPTEAQRIYQTICTLNKYGVSVRAGLISRIHNIDFKEFSDRLFKPLENIIYPINNHMEDILYISRHPEIAEIIDRYILDTPEKRIDEYFEIIKCINISYSVDDKCFKQLLKAKNMDIAFSSPNSALEVYDFALSNHPENAYLLQQMALYLNKMPDNQFPRIISLLLEAKELEPYNTSILHSLSMVYKDKIDKEDSETKKESYVREAISYIDKMVEIDGKEDSFSASARIDLKLQILSYELKAESDLTKPYIQEQVNSCQISLDSFRLKFPEDNYFNELNKRFKKILRDYEGYVKAAKDSYEQGHKTAERAMTLARILNDDGEYDKAIAILKEAMGSYRNNPKLYFQYAEYLRIHKGPEISNDILAYNYERSFSPNDSNYIAQFWFARFAYFSEDNRNIKKAKEIFTNLKSAKASYDRKRIILDIDKIDSINKFYYGIVSKLITDFGFINLEAKNETIYFNKADLIDSDIWDLLEIGQRLKFNIGYNYLGPSAIHVELL